MLFIKRRKTFPENSKIKKNFVNGFMNFVVLICVAFIFGFQLFIGWIGEHFFKMKVFAVADNLIPIRLALYLATFLLEFFGIILCFFWLFELNQPTKMHWNLKLCCFSQCCIILFSTFTRWVISANVFSGGHLLSSNVAVYLRTVHDSTTYQYGLNAVCFIAERLLATLFVKKYEKYETKKFWSAFVIFTWLMSAMLFLNLVVKWVGTLPYSIFTVGLKAFVLVGTIILYFINRHAHRKFIGNQLSLRYQNVENVRTLKVVIVYGIISFFHNVSTLILLLWLVELSKVGDTKGIGINDSVWNFVVSIFCILYPLIFLSASSKFQSLFKWLIFCHKSSNLEKQAIPRLDIRSVTGAHLNPLDETKVYFRQLDSVWN